MVPVLVTASGSSSLFHNTAWRLHVSLRWKLSADHNLCCVCRVLALVQGGQTAQTHHGHLSSTASLSKVVQKRSVSSGSSHLSSFGSPTGASTLGLGDPVVEDTSSPVGQTPALVSCLSPPGINGWRTRCRRGCARSDDGAGTLHWPRPPVAPSSSTGSAAVQGLSLFCNMRPIFDCSQISEDHNPK